jgi:MFS family permease
MMTIVITTVADRFGRRLLLIIGALLMAAAAYVFTLSDNPLWLAIAAVFGTISPSGKEVGPFLSIEQAILPQTTADQHRTAVFSAYNLVGSLAGAVGALAVAFPSFSRYPRSPDIVSCSGPTLSRRSVWFAEHDGLHPPAVEFLAANGAADAESHVGGAHAAGKKLLVAARCADAPILHYGGSARR